MTPEEELIKVTDELTKLRLLKEEVEKAKEKRKADNREYKEKNREKISEYKKERYAGLSQEEKDAFQKQEYQRRKEKMLESKKQVIKCPTCNKEMKQGSLSNHKKSQHPV